jgi:transposase-like protein
MQGSIAIEVLASLSDNGFSLDELVVATKELFEQRGLAGFVGFVLNLMDEKLAVDLVAGRSSWKPRGCCDDARYEHQDRQPRRFRTSVGRVKIQWRRLRCVHCGKSLVALRQFLGLEAYQAKTNELEKMVTEVVSEQSYRRSSDHLRRIGEIPVPHSTLHRWVVSSDCDQLDEPQDKLKVLVADGTCYKRRPGEGKDNRGQVELALGVAFDGQVKPLGAWSGASWSQIGRELGQRRKDEEQPLADVLVSDGENSLTEALAKLVNQEQRCHWHMVHELYYVMHDDQAPLDQKRQAKKDLAAILSVQLPQEDFQKVRPEDRGTLEESMRRAQQKVHDFATELFGKGYYRAGHYIRNAQKRLFTYVRYWLDHGLVSPRVSSMIERMMREIGRRLKRIAFGWSHKGAAQMARIIIKRITSAAQWESYWKKRLKITGNVLMAYRGVRLLPQPLGR